MEKLSLFVNCPSYVIVRDTPNGTIAISGTFKNRANAIQALKQRTAYIKEFPLAFNAPGFGEPYLIKLTVHTDKVKVLNFADIVKDSHHCCCERCNSDWPTTSMIAEDIIVHYEDYAGVDLSTPDKYNSWVEEVQMELNRQGLTYKEDE